MIARSPGNNSWYGTEFNRHNIYFLSNQTDAPLDCAPRFRVTGRAPELWNPDTGTSERVAVYEPGSTYTIVPLRLEASGSHFVVPRGQAAADPIVTVKRVFPRCGLREPRRRCDRWRCRRNTLWRD